MAWSVRSPTSAADATTARERSRSRRQWARCFALLLLAACALTADAVPRGSVPASHALAFTRWAEAYVTHQARHTAGAQHATHAPLSQAHVQRRVLAAMAQHRGVMPPRASEAAAAQAELSHGVALARRRMSALLREVKSQSHGGVAQSHVPHTSARMPPGHRVARLLAWSHALATTAVPGVGEADTASRVRADTGNGTVPSLHAARQALPPAVRPYIHP